MTDSAAKVARDQIIQRIRSSPDAKFIAEQLRALVGRPVRHSEGSGGTFEFSPSGTSTEFWSYGNAVAYSGAVLEILRVLDPETEWFERATTFHGGRTEPRDFEEVKKAILEEELAEKLKDDQIEARRVGMGV